MKLSNSHPVSSLSSLRSVCAVQLVFVVTFGCGKESSDRTVKLTPQKTSADSASNATQTNAQTAGSQPVRDLGPDNAGASYETLHDGRRQRDKTIWSNEVAAQQHERIFVRLWDDLRAAKDKFAVLREFPLDKFHHGKAQEPEPGPWDIESIHLGEPETTLTAEQFRSAIKTFQESGYRIVETEWHHSNFNVDSGGTAHSTVATVLHVIHASDSKRFIIRTNLDVEWSKSISDANIPLPRVIKARDVRIGQRTGKIPFEEVALPAAADPRRSERLQPMVVRDLDGDGLAEILSLGQNTTYWNQGGFQFRAEKLVDPFPKVHDAALVADFTGDGRDDLVCVNGSTGILGLLPGIDGGRFRARPIISFRKKLLLTNAMTAGDIDNDGDLDLWIAQYKPPYQHGQMPTPYYDSNDGHPAFLLENDGHGRFTDVTERAGLIAKRFRRTYASSFVDLDDDGHLDLLVTSDFAGIDIYKGDGRGGFTDVTDDWVDQRYNFGMSHTFDDFDLDGKLDFYLVGMSSTTARRLQQMGAGRDDRPAIQAMRPVMGYGNRLYMRDGERFVQPRFNDQVARTGWSWGSTSFDFDLDGDRDLYIANGHLSGKSAKDYCTTFWCHDIYDANSRENRDVAQLFMNSFSGIIKSEVSWNGYEHNALLMNHEGESFSNVGFLMGVGFEFDGRGVISEDLDADGRPDLLVVEQEGFNAGKIRQKLHVVANRLDTEGHHWIGVRLAGARSPLGAKITVLTAAGKRIAQIVSGDSLYSQHSPTAHFGLGQSDEVQWVEITWLGGQMQRLESPSVDRYHEVRANGEH